DFPTPRHIIEAGQKALDQNKTVYTQNPVLLELSEAGSNFVQVKYGQTYRAADEIIVTAGASQAVDTTLRTILTPGAEVILPAPIYPG
ncbi:aminotransferase class I/II-fold pyridoxal phosphate-dependent enzyme, partial [Lysinibacillus sp. GbtcB16]|uniref:aminotransferase class I/II-fold pyridoxal phosphate-dependent enzyme n=1 Tax=Lysinibacillus sp. GbtcB16 TaxID=2824761 RepID=UPI001C304371